MAYHMFLDDMEIPIPPSKITTSIRDRDETIDLMTAGEVDLLRSPGLTEFAFEFLLPNSNYPFNESLLFRNMGANYYINKLERLKTSKEPFMFIVVRMKPNGSMLPMTTVKVTLKDYTITDDAEEGFDQVASVKLRRYKDFGTKKIEVKTDANGNTTGTVQGTRSTTGKTIASTGTATKGGTLQQMVKKTFGNTQNLFAIASLNKIAVPAVLAMGQVVKMKQNTKKG